MERRRRTRFKRQIYIYIFTRNYVKKRTPGTVNFEKYF